MLQVNVNCSPSKTEQPWPPNGGFFSWCSHSRERPLIDSSMTLSVIPVDQQGIDNLAEGLTGFSDAGSDELQQSMMTSLFITGASSASNGRCAYLLLDDGSRMWVPNTLRCWLVDLKIVTQTYESYDPTDKLLDPCDCMLMARPMSIAVGSTAGQPLASSRTSST